VGTVGNWCWIVDEIEKAGCEPRPVHAGKAKPMLGMVNKTDKSLEERMKGVLLPLRSGRVGGPICDCAAPPGGPHAAHAAERRLRRTGLKG